MHMSAMTDLHTKWWVLKHPFCFTQALTIYTGSSKILQIELLSTQTAEIVMGALVKEVDERKYYSFSLCDY